MVAELLTYLAWWHESVKCTVVHRLDRNYFVFERFAEAQTYSANARPWHTGKENHANTIRPAVLEMCRLILGRLEKTAVAIVVFASVALGRLA